MDSAKEKQQNPLRKCAGLSMLLNITFLLNIFLRKFLITSSISKKGINFNRKLHILKENVTELHWNDFLVSKYNFPYSNEQDFKTRYFCWNRAWRPS